MANTAKYKNTSVYRNTKLSGNYLDLYQPPISVDLNNNTRIIVVAPKYEHRPDLLAYDLYGNSEVWWIFTLYNRDLLLNPMFDLKTGMELTVPTSVNDIGI